MKRAPKVLAVALVLALAAGGFALRPRRHSHAPTPPVPVDSPKVAPVETAPTGPRVWTISIGIEQYSDSTIPACHGAVRDAQAVARWCAQTAGWGDASVLRLDDLGDAAPGANSAHLAPTRANLDWAFKTWLAGRVRPEDVVVVYFAGQAATPPTAPRRAFLLPSDARSQQWEKSVWKLDEALDPVASTGRNAVLCWLDTSPEGRGRRVIEPPAGARPAGLPMLQGLARWPGVSAWLAADAKPSREATAVGALSPFTAALLKALGTPEQPQALLASLDRLRRDPSALDQGFRWLGGIDPGLTLWSAKIERLSRSRRELLLQRGHAGAISALTFSADGARLISGAQDSTLKVWTPGDRRLTRSLSYHLVGVTALALAPDGRSLVSGDGAGWLRVWDLVNDRELPAGPPHDRGIDRIAFLPDGARFATLDMDGRCVLWSTATTAEPIRELAANATGVATASDPGPFPLLVALTDGKIAVHQADGIVSKVKDGPGGIVTSRRLATDGRLVAAGDDRGALLLVNENADDHSLSFPNAIDDLAIAPGGGWLAIGTGATLRLAALDGIKPRLLDAPLALSAPTNRVAFSDDGRWLAACTTEGSLHLWSLADPEHPKPLPLEKAGESGQASTFAFAPDGLRLVSGDQSGGIRTWDLPDGNQRPAIAPRRGQIAGLSLSADARYLLQVTQDRMAQVWDLQEGRGVDTLLGEWLAGAIAPDGERIYLASEEGPVAILERASGRPAGAELARPGENWPRFGRLALSTDGQWLAAGSADGPLACVWDTRSGALVQSIRGHEDPNPITAVGFSAGAKLLLTASEDGSAKLWDWNEPGKPAREVASYTLKDEKTGEPVPIAAAQVSPAGPRRVVVGGIDGRIALWDDVKPAPLDLGSLGRSVLAATFTPDGKWLAVSGADKSVWVWSLDRPRQRLRLEPTPQHAEQVGALVAWPDSRLIASGSDDTTVKLWNLADRTLRGTLSAEQGTGNWVAYTPDGLFDCSIGGESQVTWLVNRELLSLEQVYDRFHVFRLTDKLRQGGKPEPPEPPRQAPPRIALEPPSGLVQASRAAELAVALGEPGLENVRLYQNGVAVQAADDFEATANPARRVSRVKLKKGLNRFYAMAGRPGSSEVEGRSDVVEIRYDGPDDPGQVHVLALGVSTYDNASRSLQFADRDALQIAGYLHKNVPQADDSTPGLELVLTNREVNEANVEKAFVTIRDRVRGRPEDTVVIFLAGHADALKDRFYLLLPSFPFPEIPADFTPAKRAALLAKVDPQAVLPYVALYRNISRLGALQRLVVIDACQAEAIADDPGVRQIQELIDRGAHRARTAYLLGARRGEAAGEVSALEHGLLTYALLKGLGDNNLEAVPGPPLLDDEPNADRNHDRVVTTEELRWYAERTVPRLATRFPLLALRSGAAGKMIQFRPTANLGQAPRIESASVSFPLIELPRAEGAAKEPE